MNSCGKGMFDQYGSFLEERMDPDSGLLDKLLANRTLSRIEYSNIKGHQSFCERNARLLDYICQTEKYDNLIGALRDTRQTHLVNYLNGNGERKSEYGGDWPLTENEISILDTNQESLVDLVDCSELLVRLYSAQVINRRQRDAISSEPTDLKKNEVLLDILRRSSIDDYRQVVRCLHESNQSHVAKILDEGGVVVRVHANLGNDKDADNAENDIITRFKDILSGKSLDEASRILKDIDLTIIAAKKGQSVILYTYCRTAKELTDLYEMNFSGKLRSTIEGLFSQLLLCSTNAEHAEVTVENLKDGTESTLTQQLCSSQMDKLTVTLPAEEYKKRRSYFSDECIINRAVGLFDVDERKIQRREYKKLMDIVPFEKAEDDPYSMMLHFEKGDFMMTTAPENIGQTNMGNTQAASEPSFIQYPVIVPVEGLQPDLETQLNELWARVTQEDRPPIEPGIDDRPVWKTVRIFVSSTFSDFHQEREDLVKKVFTELRIWCEERCIHLIDCDLRWGVPENVKTDMALRICLEEIERCYKENKAPYFLNLTCERVGSVPHEDVLAKLEPEFKSEHKVLKGLSVTEMEIVYAAYHVNNPNALFLIRDESFLRQMKSDQTTDFIEKEPLGKKKLEFLKRRIHDRFETNGRVKKYTCKYIEGKTLYSHCPGEKARPALELDSSFSQSILKFFKERIEKQYPLTKGKLDEFEEAKYHHNAFMESREEMVFGRDGVIAEINDYVEKQITTSPKLLLGEAGTGKSSIMARAASQFRKLHHGDSRWIVFYHFVGAVPNSGSLLLMLRRLLHEIGFGGNLPSTLDRALTDVNSELSRNHDDQRFAIFIDALNQLDLDLKTEAMIGWLPETLGRNVRCVLSMITQSDAHKSLIRRANPPIVTPVPQLGKPIRKEIVAKYFEQFKKELTKEQLDLLMSKKASENCLWLKIASEEMRVFGEFKTITKLIEQLPDSLPALLKHVVGRLEKEVDEVLLKSTLCLLEVSKAGLLENELRGLMVDKENLFYRKGDKVRENDGDILPAGEWALVYYQLKYFLRPYGDSSEGRLDFYHRTLSKVVREMYLSVDKIESQTQRDDNKYKWWHRKLANYFAKCRATTESQTQRDDNKYKWWHRKLANYFAKCRATTESLSKPTYVRGVEEYPYHLIELKKLAQTDAERDQYSAELALFLSDMRTFKELFSREFSEILLRYWREAGDENYEKMTKVYIEGLRELEAKNVKTEILDEHYRFVIRLLMQAQKGGEGLELLGRCQELVNKTTNESERKQKLIDVLSLKADIRSKLMPRTQSKEQIPDLEAIIKVNEEAIQLIESLKAEKDMRLLKAQRLLQTAYTRGGIAYRYEEDESEKKAEQLGKSFEEAREAMRLYKELGDIGQELEAELTLATLCRAKDDTEEQIKKKATKASNVKKTYVYGSGKGYKYYDSNTVAEVDSSGDLKVVSSKQLKFGETIAEGRFAVIKKAQLIQGNETSVVATKRLTRGFTDADANLMADKIAFQSRIPAHVNVVKFLKQVDDSYETGPMMVLEYCEMSLKDWLNRIERINSNVLEDMSIFTMNIANGVKHLHENQVVHRRLGARNVLLKEQYGGLVAKLIGFGPNREDKDGGQASLPIKWLAPETLETLRSGSPTYDKNSDAWSFGITVWEIYSKGEVPFPELPTDKVKKLLTKDKHMVLTRPAACPDDLFKNVMAPCWNFTAGKRPTFAEICSKIDTFRSGTGLEPVTSKPNKIIIWKPATKASKVEEVYVYSSGKVYDHDYSSPSGGRMVISSNQLKFGDTIETGRFAVIKKAQLTQRNETITVATKGLKHGYTDTDTNLMAEKIAFFQSEILTHVNVVKFLGQLNDANTAGPIMVLEYCEISLKDWLSGIENINSNVLEDMSIFTMNIASGVKYLHEKNVVHRRLGVRNVLLKKEYGGLVAKLIGFGPNREDKGGGQASLPIKYLAPETLNTLMKSGSPSYDKNSDVWSFGITVWEIYSKGEMPFSNMQPDEVKKLLTKNKCMTLARPAACPEDLFKDVMAPCWNFTAGSRPNFTEICSKIDTFRRGTGQEPIGYYTANSPYSRTYSGPGDLYDVAA